MQCQNQNFDFAIAWSLNYQTQQKIKKLGSPQNIAKKIIARENYVEVWAFDGKKVFLSY
jgi:hypothetical protein